MLIDTRGRLGNYREAMQAAARGALARAARRAGLTAAHELSLLLCDNAGIRRLNARWRGKDEATDGLSFPLYVLSAPELPLTAASRPPAGPLGDIVVALPTARRDARELGEAAEEHLERLLVHGLLHLLGYDHHRPAERRRMARAEAWLLDNGGRGLTG